MATANPRKKRPANTDVDEPLVSRRLPAGPLRDWLRRRAPLRFWGVTLLLTLVVFWLAPGIVARTPLLNRVLGSLASDLNGTLTAESASLGWLSPVVLGDVQLRDEKGELLLRVPSVEGTRSLWLLLGGSQLGEFRLHQPELRLAISHQGSNLEAVLARWLGDDRPPSLECPGVMLEVLDGTLAIDDVEHDRHWQIEKLKLNCTLARDWSEPMALSASGNLPQPDRTAKWQANVEASRVPLEEGPPLSEAAASIKSDGLPLSIVEAFVHRIRPELTLSGAMSSDLKITWKHRSGAPPQLELGGQIEAENFLLADPSLGKDQLRLAKLTVPAQVAYDGQHCTIEHCALQSDVGRVKLIGPLNVPLVGSLRDGVLTALGSESFSLTGELDLARLAATLPQTIRIRPGTEIAAGQVNLQFTRRREQQQAQWLGRLETTNLVARHQGKPVTWNKPLEVTFEAHDGPSGLVIDKLICDSKFLEIEAAGALDELSASAIYDLNKLAGELRQFIDLRGVELAGDGWSYVTWKRKEGGRFEADGEFQIRQFRLAAPNRQPWNEENLVMLLSLVGQYQDQQLASIQSATLKLDSSDDKLTLRLLRPVSPPRAEADWPLHLEASGNLATWTTRLKPWLPEMRDGLLAGNCQIGAQGVASAERIVIEDFHGQANDLRIRTASLAIDEPLVGLQLNGQWTSAAQQLEIEKLKFASNTISVDGQKIVVGWQVDQPPQIAGVLTYAGDVNRLQQWTFDPRQPSIWTFAGQLQGQLEITPLVDAPQIVQARLDTQVNNLVGTRPGSQPWRQSSLRLVAAGRYDRANPALYLDQMRVISNLVNCDAVGRLTDLSGRRNLVLNGQLDYDPEELLALLRPYLAEGIQVAANRQARPFSFSGPLAALSAPPTAAGAAGAVAAIDRMAQEFTGEAAFGWTGAELYGFRVGSGELRGKLAGGKVDIQPLDLAVSEGRLTASPTVRLWPEPKELLLPRGPLLTQVRISPAMCEQALKYIAPVLAGVAQAEGKFSLALDGCRLPVDRPASGEMAGQFTVHSVEVSAGPLVRELAVLLDRPGVARLSRESVVPFRLVQGRVYHRDLELVFPEITIRTHGSVGLDQSLSIMAEMPVPPKWLGGNPLGTALKNQTIRLPIGGTLSQPQIDRRALAQVSADFVRGGAGNLLRDTLNKQLDRFFNPPGRDE